MNLRPIKATVLDEGAFRLLAIPFTGPLPFPGAPRGADLDAQWFDPAVDIRPDWLPWRPVDWHHGDDPLMGRTVIGKAGDLGRADGPSDEPDEDGWWVTVWMKLGERRVELVRKLADRGAQLYGSSETVPGLAAVKARDGQVLPWRRDLPGAIVRWPYWRQTLSTSPQNTHSVLRPLKATLDELEAAGERPGATFWTDVEDALRTLGHTLRTPSATGAGGAKAGQADDALRAALTSLLGAADALGEAITR